MIGGTANAGGRALETYRCRLPDGKLGSGMVLDVFDNAGAVLTIKGAIIAGERDPEVPYTYVDRGDTLDLSPRSDAGRQMGTMRYSRADNTLTFDNRGRRLALNCAGG